MIDSVMQSLLNNVALLEFLNPENILNWLGPWALIGVTFIIFAECGLLIGFFLPGDSLIFLTGLFVAQGFINEPIWLVATTLAIAAVSGNLVGYWIGKAIGPKLFEKPESKIFKRVYVEQTHKFFEKYGAYAIILARFVPIVRTFITATAGIVGMDFRKFATYSAIGGLIWGAGIALLGYFLGNFPIVKDNVGIVLLLVVFVTTAPIAIEYIRHRRQTPAQAIKKIAEEGS